MCCIDRLRPPGKKENLHLNPKFGFGSKDLTKNPSALKKALSSVSHPMKSKMVALTELSVVYGSPSSGKTLVTLSDIRRSILDKTIKGEDSQIVRDPRIVQRVGIVQGISIDLNADRTFKIFTQHLYTQTARRQVFQEMNLLKVFADKIHENTNAGSVFHVFNGRKTLRINNSN